MGGAQRMNRCKDWLNHSQKFDSVKEKDKDMRACPQLLHTIVRVFHYLSLSMDVHWRGDDFECGGLTPLSFATEQLSVWKRGEY